MLLPLKKLNYNLKLRVSNSKSLNKVDSYRLKGTSFRCSDIFFNRGNSYTSARTMDFANDLDSKLVVNNRGIKSASCIKNIKGKIFSWTSRYGSVTVNCLDNVVTDGLNEKGLSGGLLWLEETKYSQPGEKPALSSDKWVQYFLDNCEDVDEVINLSKDIDVVSYVKEGFNEHKPVPLHAVFHDKKGKTAILEYKEGELHVYQSKENSVLTNSPFYPQQIEHFERYKDEYSEKILISEPIDSKDRFINLSLLVDKINPFSISKEVIGKVDGILDRVTIKPKDDIKGTFCTLWSVIRDHCNLVYYFKLDGSKFATSLVDLKNIDFSGKKRKRLDD